MADINQTGNKEAQVKKPTSKFKKKVKKYLYIALTFFVLIVGVYIYWNFFFTFSDGYRTGLLQSFSREGTVFKTYEGEMIMSSVASNKDVVLASEKFMFSVTSKDLANQLDTLQGKNVIVHYSQKNATLPWRGHSTFIVNSVKRSD